LEIACIWGQKTASNELNSKGFKNADFQCLKDPSKISQF
jgi:hypothetical protein